jgi:hypothetical protein
MEEPADDPLISEIQVERQPTGCCAPRRATPGIISRPSFRNAGLDSHLRNRLKCSPKKGRPKIESL